VVKKQAWHLNTYSFFFFFFFFVVERNLSIFEYNIRKSLDECEKKNNAFLSMIIVKRVHT